MKNNCRDCSLQSLTKLPLIRILFHRFVIREYLDIRGLMGRSLDKLLLFKILKVNVKQNINAVIRQSLLMRCQTWS